MFTYETFETVSKILQCEVQLSSSDISVEWNFPDAAAAEVFQLVPAATEA